MYEPVLCTFMGGSQIEFTLKLIYTCFSCLIFICDTHFLLEQSMLPLIYEMRRFSHCLIGSVGLVINLFTKHLVSGEHWVSGKTPVTCGLQ